MKIKVNDTIFNNAEWAYDPKEGIGTLEIHTDESILDLIDAFGEGNEIIEYDDNDVIKMRWYNAAIISVAEISTEYRIVVAKFHISVIDDGAEQVLQGNIDECIDGVFEIAELAAEAMEIAEGIQTNVEETREIVDAMHDSLNRVWSFYNRLADRVAALENKGA